MKYVPAMPAKKMTAAMANSMRIWATAKGPWNFRVIASPVRRPMQLTDQQNDSVAL